jgi:hypothetical protein
MIVFPSESPLRGLNQWDPLASILCYFDFTDLVVDIGREGEEGEQIICTYDKYIP